MFSVMDEQSARKGVPSLPELSCGTSPPCLLPAFLPDAARQSPALARPAQTPCISERKPHVTVVIPIYTQKDMIYDWFLPTVIFLRQSKVVRLFGKQGS